MRGRKESRGRRNLLLSRSHLSPKDLKSNCGGKACEKAFGVSLLLSLDSAVIGFERHKPPGSDAPTTHSEVAKRATCITEGDAVSLNVTVVCQLPHRAARETAPGHSPRPPGHPLPQQTRPSRQLALEPRARGLGPVARLLQRGCWREEGELWGGDASIWSRTGGSPDAGQSSGGRGQNQRHPRAESARQHEGLRLWPALAAFRER